MKVDAAFAGDLVARALKSGADKAEVFCKSFKNITVEIKDQADEALSSSFSSGYSVRVIKNNRLGFSFSTDPAEAGRVIMRALEASQHADKDFFLDIAASSPAESVMVFDEAIRDIREDDAISMAMLIEKAAYDADSRIQRLRRPSASFTLSETVIANSAELQARYEATSCTAQITAIAESGGESQTGWDFTGSRLLNDISFEQVGRNAAAAAVRLLGSRKIQGLKTDIILDSAVAVDFLGVFAASLSAESVQKGKSLLAGRLNTAVVSPLVTLIDNGRLAGKLGSRPIDDEGIATQATSLLQEGVLRSYLYNTYTAKKGDTASTGNAVRSGFSSLPSVGMTNLYLEPAPGTDRIPQKELFSTVQKGLYIVDAMGIHTVNPISGDFSIGITGIWIENGSPAFPVKEAVISGNLLDFFGKVSGMSDDMRFYGSIGSPSLIISDIDVSA